MLTVCRRTDQKFRLAVTPIVLGGAYVARCRSNTKLRAISARSSERLLPNNSKDHFSLLTPAVGPHIVQLSILSRLMRMMSLNDSDDQETIGITCADQLDVRSHA